MLMYRATPPARPRIESFLMTEYPLMAISPSGFSGVSHVSVSARRWGFSLMTSWVSSRILLEMLRQLVDKHFKARSQVISGGGELGPSGEEVFLRRGEEGTSDLLSPEEVVGTCSMACFAPGWEAWVGYDAKNGN